MRRDRTARAFRQRPKPTLRDAAVVVVVAAVEAAAADAVALPTMP
jgi:hypothetical protein